MHERLLGTMKLFLFLMCMVCTAYVACGYHILVIFPVPSRSHNTLGKGIVDALLDAGHQVTWASPFPPKEPVHNLTIIDMSAIKVFVEGIDMTNPVYANKGISFVREFSRNISRAATATPALRDAIINGKFDAVVTETFFSDVDAGYAAVMQVPWIMLNGVIMMPPLEKQLDEVRSIATIPLMFNNAPVPMGIFDRLFNTFVYGMMTLDGWMDYATLLDLYSSWFAPLASARGVPLPPFSDAFYNVSILFVNSHSSFAPAPVLPPNVIEIGGYHISKTTPPLPQDLQDLMDSSKQGVIYFSMGSVLKSASFPPHTRRELLQIFGKLPYTVFWKFEEQLDNLPKNVHIRSWMPQSSILAHPNIRLFITHGGLLSTLETLHYGVPQIVIPMFGDQPANANRAVRNGYAQKVTFSDSMAGDIKEAIDEMMGDDKYYKRAKYLSKLFNSRPVPQSKLISHYVELAIETKGTMKLFIFLVSIVCSVCIVSGYNILVVFPAPSRSHNTLGKGIVDALLDAGHQVTWASSFPPKDPVNNLRIIDLSPIRALVEDILIANPMNADKSLSFVRDFSRNISRATIATPAIRDAIVNGKFDAVVTEYFFSDVDAGYAAVMQVPWILVNCVIMMPPLEKQVDEVRSIATIPLMFNNAPTPMGIFDRLVNTFIYGMMTIDGWMDYPTLLDLYDSLFAPLATAKGVPLPAFSDAFYNVSILFVNSHSSFAPAPVLPPNAIEIGGYHISKTTPPLPQDLQDIIVSSKQGVIYFSMGSVFKSASFSPQTRRELLQVFEKLPYTVLWKFEEQLDNLPKNVHVRPWMPQSSILAHPNVKLFITHGGLLSTLETLHYGVPQIVIPMFGDQPSNADRAVRNGYAKSIQFSDSIAEDIKQAIDEMMGDEKYYKRVKYLSKLFNSRPVPQTKLISHYVELAIETKGAFHLRSRSLLYSWYQRVMLDQLVIVLVVLYAVYRTIRVGINKFIKKKNDNLSKLKIN